MLSLHTKKDISANISVDNVNPNSLYPHPLTTYKNAKDILYAHIGGYDLRQNIKREIIAKLLTIHNVRL